MPPPCGNRDPTEDIWSSDRGRIHEEHRARATVGAVAGERPAVLVEALAVSGLPAADLDGRVLVARGAREVEAEPAGLEREVVAPAVAARRARCPPNGGPRCRRRRNPGRPRPSGGIPERAFEPPLPESPLRSGCLLPKRRCEDQVVIEWNVPYYGVPGIPEFLRVAQAEFPANPLGEPLPDQGLVGNRLHGGNLPQGVNLRRVQLDGEVLQAPGALPLQDGATQLVIQGEFDGPPSMSRSTPRRS